MEIEKLAEAEGLEMLILGMTGVPPVAKQSDLTPLQREVLVRAYVKLKKAESKAVREGGW